MRAIVTAFFIVALLHAPLAAADAPVPPKPIKALLLLGNCCHDFGHIKTLITEAISKRVNVEWTILQEAQELPDGKRVRLMSLLAQGDWAANYDVIVHFECFVAAADAKVIESVVRAHEQGVPAVILHCAAENFRDANCDRWHQFVGIETNRHEPLATLTVNPVKPDHAIMKGFPQGWATPTRDEAYVVEKTFDACMPLATAVGPKSGKVYPVIWVNTFGKARIFGTTLGHNTDTWRDDAFLDLIARGLLYVTGHLDENGKPAAGYEAKH